MDKIIKKSFQIFSKNSSIMQPTIFYYLIMIVFAGIMKNRVFGNSYQLIILSFLSFLLFAAFLAGWLYMIQFAVSVYQPFDKNDKDYDLKIATYNLETLKKFFVGVGNYFIPVMAVILSLFIIQGAIYVSGAKLFDIDLQSMINMPNNLLQNYVTNNTKNVALFLLYLGGLSHLLQFLTIFWLPSIYVCTKKPLSAFVKSLKFLFRNIFSAIGLYFIIIVFSIMFMFVFVILQINYILSLISLILGICFVNYIVVLIFTYYREKILKELVNEVNQKDIFIKSTDIGNEENANKE